MRHAVVNHISIFVDGCGYNIWTTRSHGRARLGERAHRQVRGQRGRNVTVALTISPTNGLVFHSAFLGGMTRQRFNDFLTQVRLNLDPNEHVIFIYDGAPARNNPAIPGPNFELKKLPRYSPFRNSVEQAISAFKSSHKSGHRSSRAARTDEQQRRGKTTRNRVRQFPHSVATSHPQRNIGTITAAKCGQWYRLMPTYIPRCLNSEEIEG